MQGHFYKMHVDKARVVDCYTGCMQEHAYRVRTIQQQVSRFYAQKQQVRIFHGHTNSTRRPEFHKDHTIDTSALNHIIAINKKELYVLVEPSVSMEQLVGETLTHGLVPPVVMEFPGITVGGGIQGGPARAARFDGAVSTSAR